MHNNTNNQNNQQQPDNRQQPPQDHMYGGPGNNNQQQHSYPMPMSQMQPGPQGGYPMPAHAQQAPAQYGGTQSNQQPQYMDYYNQGHPGQPGGGQRMPMPQYNPNQQPGANMHYNQQDHMGQYDHQHQQNPYYMQMQAPNQDLPQYNGGNMQNGQPGQHYENGVAGVQQQQSSHGVGHGHPDMSQQQPQYGGHQVPHQQTMHDQQHINSQIPQQAHYASRVPIVDQLPKFFKTQQPIFSTLNMDVIPDSEYLDQLDTYKAKFSTGLLKQITKQVGLDTVDERVYKIISIMMEDKLCQIVQEVKAMQQQSLPNKEHISVHQLLQLVGRDQSDGRTEQQIRDRLKEDEKKVQKTVLEFEDLRSAMNEFGVYIRKPPFLEDKQKNKYTVEKKLGAAAKDSSTAIQNRNEIKEDFLRQVATNSGNIVKHEDAEEEDYKEQQ